MTDEIKINNEHIGKASLELLVSIHVKQEVFQQLLMFTLAGNSSEQLDRLKSVYRSECMTAHKAITEKLFELYGFLDLDDLLPKIP